MLKKTITYEDLNGKEVTETHYFHLTQADVVEMQLSEKGGLEKHLERVIASEDGAEIIRVFKDLIAKSYGKRSEDGARFVKSEQELALFMDSEAYSTLFMTLVTDAAVAAEFVNGILPKGLQDTVEKIGGAMGKPRTPAEAAAMGQPVKPYNETKPSDAEELPAEVESNVFTADNPKILTRAEVDEMDGDELKSGLATGRYKLQ